MTGQSSDDTPPQKKGALSRLSSGVSRLTRAKGPVRYADRSHGGLKIVIATDAWKPQLKWRRAHARHAWANPHRPSAMKCFISRPTTSSRCRMPSYPEIRLSLMPNRKVAKMHERVSAGRHSHRNRRPHWPRRAPFLQAPGLSVSRRVFTRGFQNTPMSAGRRRFPGAMRC